MKENKRKCFKCGSSPADDPETTLFRFPKPGSSNGLRCELWAKYCCPDKQWFNIDFQLKLYTEHRMLCHRHFKETAFVDFPSKKLRRFASPDMELESSQAAVNLPEDFAFTLDAYLTKEHTTTEDLKVDKATSVKQNKFNAKTQQVLKNKDKHNDTSMNREDGAWGGSIVRRGDTHTGETLFSCHHCLYKTGYKDYLVIHMRTHTGEKPHSCKYCDSICARAYYLKIHTRTHTGEKPHYCKYCDYKCFAASQLKRHMKIYTGEKPDSCEYCDYKCIRAYYLKIHTRTHNGEKSHYCKYCDYKCSAASRLKRHMRTHTGEKPHSCEYCGYTCSQASQLKSHMRTHTGEKPHYCKFCNYKCSDTINSNSPPLTHHSLRRTHTGEKPHSEIPTILLMNYQRGNDCGNRRLPPQNSNWREPDSDDDDPPPQQPKRNAVQQDKFRENHPKTQEALKKIQDKIDKALFFGFGDPIFAEKATDFSVQKSAAVVPVTTRAVGFYTQWVFKKVYELYRRRPDRIPECSPYAFYRVALAQYEYRLLCGKSSQINTMGIEAGLFYRPRLTIEQRDIIKATPVTFSPLANLLAGVGSFEYENGSYYVRCPNDRVLGILFSNLQAVVDAIANPATPHAERLSFYDLNPLPFALWCIDQPVVVVGHPVLLNPGDFMPPGYGIEEFERDVHQVKNFISFVARKEINMLSEGATIDYEASGHQRILVSNDATGLRNPDRISQGQWADEGLPQGDLESFWTPAGISSQDFFMGTINLVGERRPGAGDAFAFRSPLIARAIAKHRWTTFIDNMLG